jgi:hypothetical protein
LRAQGGRIDIEAVASISHFCANIGKKTRWKIITQCTSWISKEQMNNTEAATGQTRVDADLGKDRPTIQRFNSACITNAAH